MKTFNDELHSMVLSEDGSYTAYSKEYGEHYHSTKDGALFESLKKHVEPAFRVKQNQDEITVLDICFGLGFNTLAAIYYHKKNSLASKLNIFSPELDASLVRSLLNFNYPKEFDDFLHIIANLIKYGVYDEENIHIELFLGDAREYVKKFPQEKFDIVFQDAFSPSSNSILWTSGYFSDIKKIIKKDGVLTTYSISLPVRLALHENGFKIYLNKGDGFRDATVASLDFIDGFESVDMEHKIKCNPDVVSLKDL
jgi:tRNA U34 5-methylaminomethyl-2-thiouridine-forming methyltransferase MnmC